MHLPVQVDLIIIIFNNPCFLDTIILITYFLSVKYNVTNNNEIESVYSDVGVSYMLQPIIPVYVEKTQIVTEQHFLAVKLNADNNMFF